MPKAARAVGAAGAAGAAPSRVADELLDEAEAERHGVGSYGYGEDDSNAAILLPRSKKSEGKKPRPAPPPTAQERKLSKSQERKLRKLQVRGGARSLSARCCWAMASPAIPRNRDTRAHTDVRSPHSRFPAHPTPTQRRTRR